MFIVFGQVFLLLLCDFLGLRGDVVWSVVVWRFLLPSVVGSWCVMFCEWGIRCLKVFIFKKFSANRTEGATVGKDGVLAVSHIVKTHTL